MSNVISLLDVLPSTIPLADDPLAEMQRLKIDLGLLHSELQNVLSQLSRAETVLSLVSSELDASTAEKSELQASVHGL